jgi:integrase
MQFTDGNGKRRTIRLGKLTKRQAAEVERHVRSILGAKLAGYAIDAADAAWLGELPPKLYNRLAAADLVPPRQSSPTLDSFLQSWLAKRNGAKPNSRTNYQQAADKLTTFYGDAAPLDSITPSRAEDFARDVADRHAREWAWRLVKFARQFFKSAVRDKLISANPFEGVKPPAKPAKPRRQFNISRDAAAAVLAACPDNEWRLIFALSRFGGLRCPSEHLSLRWSDVDWERNRFTVRAPKTEHHEDGGVRVVPIFPELRPYLDAVWDEAPEGAEFVIRRYRQANANLRTQLRRIVKRAGLEPWPKLFHNLRATRQTELSDVYPSHVVCAWLGNSPRIAHKHYLQVTDAHFDAAAGDGSAAKALHDPLKSAAKALHHLRPPASAEVLENAENTGKTQDSAGMDEGSDYTRQESNLQPMAP